MARRLTTHGHVVRVYRLARHAGQKVQDLGAVCKVAHEFAEVAEPAQGLGEALVGLRELFIALDDPSHCPDACIGKQAEGGRKG